MSTLREIFQDDRGALSSGRVFAGYCVVGAFTCWLAGVMLPEQSGHAQSGMQAFLAAGASFYTAGKVSERFGKSNCQDSTPKDQS